MSRPPAGFWAELLRICAAPAIWFVHLMLAYGIVAVVCARGLAAHAVLGVGVVPLAVGGATLLALLATAAVGLHALRELRAEGPLPDARRFSSRVAVVQGALAFVAIVWTSLPLFWLPTCAGPAA